MTAKRIPCRSPNLTVGFRAFAGFFAFFLFSYFAAAQPREKLWDQVAVSMSNGLPQTAVTNLEMILASALAEKAYPEAAKAVALKCTLQTRSDQDADAEKIKQLTTSLPAMPPAMQPILHTILAHWYWHYFNGHRWQFERRTATAAPPGDDFTTWDSPRLFAEIEREFQIALANDASLKSIPVGVWDGLLEKGSMPDTTRPTLYDFIARETLNFYAESSPPGSVENPFEIAAADPIFDSADQFLAWQPQTTDTNSHTLKAVRLFQDLLRFHLRDPAPALAFAQADLDRLVWAWNFVSDPNKDARCVAALEAFAQAHADQEISAEAYDRQAGILYQNNDYAAAHRAAVEGEKRFPNSPGARLCHNLRLDLETKWATITTERIWNAPWPQINVRYRNIDSLELRAIPADWETFLDRHRHRPENLSEKERAEILRRKSALEWQVKLPALTNFTETNADVPAPENLKPGFYFLAASHKSGATPDSDVSMTPIWVSDLALTLRVRDNAIEGFVTEAQSGEPIADAKVSVWHLDDQGNRVPDPNLAPDTNGFFSMNSQAGRAYLFRARAHGQEIATQDQYGIDRDRPSPPITVAYFYTDRAIYRPGQTIQFKGVCLHFEPGATQAELLKNGSATVVFNDANSKEIARQTFRINDYGSFTGSFTAPRDRLLGAMSLNAIGSISGQTEIRVEEYKRPKFLTTLDAPQAAPKLNGKVTLTGHAMSYTGAPIDSAHVTYHVMREPRFPVWWGWWHPHDQYFGQEISHGSTTTAADGSFAIEFDAAPDDSISPTNEPVFNFTINADVTDNTGETRSADHVIHVGYAALQAELTGDDWQTVERPVELEISTKSLDDEPQSAQGEVKIYALQAPAKIDRPSFHEQENAPIDWPLGNIIAQKSFTTGASGKTNVSFSLPSGAYRAVLETRDRFGKEITALLPIQVLDPTASKLDLKIPHLLAAPKWEAQPGDDFTALWGTGYPEGRACIELARDNKIFARYWTSPGRTLQQIHIPITEAMRGGVTVYLTQIHDNRAWFESRKIDVPWKNKELSLKWEHFTSKLKPGQQETWTAVISGPTAEKDAAELVATLYDESLDAFAPLEWQRLRELFAQDESSMQSLFVNDMQDFSLNFGLPLPPDNNAETYRHFPATLVDPQMESFTHTRDYYQLQAVGYINVNISRATTIAGVDGVPMESPAPMPSGPDTSPHREARSREAEKAKQPIGEVTARKNLNETAFFFPQLLSDSNGVVRLTFTMPEALTKWHFMALAHDKSLRSGFLEAHAVTAKDLMVEPNPPRFLREGDVIEFAVKVSNQSDAPQSGTVRLTFHDAATDKTADAALGNTNAEQTFDVPAKQSRAYSWRIHVPDGCGFLTYNVVGATAKLSDGEEGAIPVLSRRVLVTESLPLSVRGPATNQFHFDKLLASGASSTLQNQSLTVQMVSNPAWYAVMALPYLMEFPHECNEQVFNRLYANALARHIANSDPRIRHIFDLWKNTPALDSPLEKNQDLKSVMIEETPWLRDAEKESQARHNVGNLFDKNRLDYETASIRQKLLDAQLPDGRWPWFSGGQASDFITLYIVTGFGRLRHLGVDLKYPALKSSLRRLDEWLAQKVEDIQKSPHPEAYVPDSLDCLFLYGRSFFLKDFPIAAKDEKAIQFMLGQARKGWLQTRCRQSQGQLALAFNRWGGDDNGATARAIMKSLQERSASSDEMGMYWNDDGPSWWWYRAPIETQAVMIEAFDEVAHDQAAVDACCVWLLKQKQTQNWPSTKSTADAIYALLLRGPNLLSSDALVQTKVGALDITPATAEAGTGFYERRFSAPEIKPAFGNVTVTKTDRGIAWGGIHWQYLEDISKVTPHDGGPLSLTKSLFLKINTAHGPVLQPVHGPLHVGDELVVRLELRADRDMEYIHLKDQRGSGAEPLNVLSQYKYQDGLGYYESARDTASHFFIDYLPKGSYVFEYSVHLQLRGQYQSGMAEIESMYAPEFNCHSESFALAVL